MARASFWDRLLAVVDWLAAKHDNIPLHRTQFLVACCWVAAVVGVISAVSADTWFERAVVGSFAVFVFALPFALRLNIRAQWVQGVAIVSAMILMLIMATAAEVQEFRQLYWFPILPLTGGLLLGTLGIWLGGAAGLGCIWAVIGWYHGMGALSGAPGQVLVDSSLYLLAVSMLTGIYDRLQRSALGRLQLTLESRKAFLAQMSHELRTPMNGVLGIVELLRLDGSDIALPQALDTIHRSGQAMVSLIDELLDHAKLEAGKLRIHSEPCEPARIVSEVVNLNRGQASAGVEVRFEVDASVPDWVLADPLRLRQIFQNLLSNALKFTAKGEVCVLLAWSDGRLRGEVRDTGVGVSPEALKRLFQPFEQASDMTASRYGGTGLGLSIGRSLAQLMGGDLTATSSIGQGSRFHFDILAPVAARGGSASRAAIQLSRKGRVLIVEDNTVNQLITSKLCDSLGLESVVVEDGQQALDRLASDPGFDVVLMDCHMPVKDGWTAATELRSSGLAAARVPIVALTASVLSEDVARCMHAGMDAVLRKPLDRASLAQELDRQLIAKVG